MSKQVKLVHVFIAIFICAVVAHFVGQSFAKKRAVSRLRSLGGVVLTSGHAGTLRDDGFVFTGVDDRKLEEAVMLILKHNLPQERIRLIDTCITNDGLAELGKLPQLALLEISGCQLSAESLECLRHASSLSTLILTLDRDPQLRLSSLNGVDNLRVLHVTVDSKSIGQLSEFDSEAVLFVTGVRLDDTDVLSIEGRCNVRGLTLDGCPLTGIGLSHLRAFSALEYLSLNDSNVSDSDVSILSLLAGVRLLQLRNTKVTDSGLLELGKMKASKIWVSSPFITPDGLAQVEESEPKATLYCLSVGEAEQH